jgi:hypothetical protein
MSDADDDRTSNEAAIWSSPAKAGGGNRTTLAVGRSDSLLSLAHDSHQQNRRAS